MSPPLALPVTGPPPSGNPDNPSRKPGPLRPEIRPPLKKNPSRRSSEKKSRRTILGGALASLDRRRDLLDFLSP